MDDLVERTCQVITCDAAVVYNPHSFADFTNGEFHPVVCGQPAYDFVDYGDHRVYMCLRHYNGATNGTIKVDIAGIGWNHLVDDSS